jgi:hypothetical protein
MPGINGTARDKANDLLLASSTLLLTADIKLGPNKQVPVSA